MYGYTNISCFKCYKYYYPTLSQSYYLEGFIFLIGARIYMYLCVCRRPLFKSAGTKIEFLKQSLQQCGAAFLGIKMCLKCQVSWWLIARLEESIVPLQLKIQQSVNELIVNLYWDGNHVWRQYFKPDNQIVQLIRYDDKKKNKDCLIRVLLYIRLIYLHEGKTLQKANLKNRSVALDI